MKLIFPENFLWGTATSALQIESAFDHDWKGFKAKDGSILEKNIEHEKHRDEDASIISRIGNAYRFNPDWSKLQRKPKGPLDKNTVEEYRTFLGKLKDQNLHLMLALHHFANPRWLVKPWLSEESVDLFNDYAKKMAAHFGDLVDSWITINEPGVCASMGYLLGNFPPFKENLFAAYRVLKNLSKAHRSAYQSLKQKFPNHQVGVAKNAMDFHPESPLGKIPAAIVNKVFMDYVTNLFQESDFIGINYYGRISFRPGPITEIYTPKKLDELKRPHDKIWEYYPEGLKTILLRFSEKYGKPLIITEQGCCTDDDDFRIKSIRDHLKSAHDSIKAGVDLRGYFHWSTFDNFELILGLSYRFGLVAVDFKTQERKLKNSARFYAAIAKNNYLEGDWS